MRTREVASFVAVMFLMLGFTEFDRALEDFYTLQVFLEELERLQREEDAARAARAKPKPQPRGLGAWSGLGRGGWLEVVDFPKGIAQSFCCW